MSPLFALVATLVSVANAADIMTYTPAGQLIMDDSALTSSFSFTASKAGTVYLQGPAGLKFSQCAFPIADADIGKTFKVNVGGVPIFDDSKDAALSLSAKFYDKATCASTDSSYKISRKIAKATTCKSTGDPHFQTSYGADFDNQEAGLFTLFESDMLTVQVLQEKMAKNSKVSMNKVVAVRYGNRVFILDIRGNAIPKVMSEVIKGANNFIEYLPPTTKQSYHHIKFKPCQSEVTLTVNKWEGENYINVVINAAALYNSRGIAGVCGLRSKPANFDAFKVDASKSLLDPKTAASALKALAADSAALVNCQIPTGVDACKLPPVTTTVTVTLPPYTPPPTASTTSTSTTVAPTLSSTTSTTSATTSSTSAPTLSSSTSTAQSSTTSTTTSATSSPTVIPPNYNETVHTHCTKAMISVKCGDLLPIDFYVNSCISDCHGTGSLAPIELTKIAMTVDCRTRTDLRKCHPDPVKASGAVSIQVTLGLNDNNCPKGCSGNGICASTGCVCSAGYTGVDCADNLKALAAPNQVFASPIVYPQSAPVYGYVSVPGQVSSPSVISSNVSAPVAPAPSSASAPAASDPVVAVDPVAAPASANTDSTTPVYSFAAPVFTGVASVASILFTAVALF